MRTQAIRSRENPNLELIAFHGHFATRHSHNSHYLDITRLKHEYSLAHDTALAIANHYIYEKSIDTIICMDGSEVIGAFLAQELAKNNLASVNSEKDIFVVTPEFNTNGQMIFRDNYEPMINGKNILILNGSITTGSTLNRAIESVLYYGGKIRGVAAIYSSVDSVATLPVHSIFQARDIPDYHSYRSDNCPLCKNRQKIDAIVSSYGYSVL